MEKIVKPIKAISFEAALRNLASRLTLKGLGVKALCVKLVRHTSIILSVMFRLSPWACVRPRFWERPLRASWGPPGAFQRREG